MLHGKEMKVGIKMTWMKGKELQTAGVQFQHVRQLFYILVMSPNYGRKPKLNKNLIKPKHFEHFTDEEMHTAFEDLKDIKHLI